MSYKRYELKTGTAIRSANTNLLENILCEYELRWHSWKTLVEISGPDHESGEPILRLEAAGYVIRSGLYTVYLPI